MTRLVKAVIFATVVAALSAGCNDDLNTQNTIEPYTSFGGIIYREGCQRVAYAGQLQQKQAGLRDTVDVSGSLGRAVCVDGNAPPGDSPDKLKAIVGQKDLLIATVDLILPKDFLNTLEGFLEALAPLADDDTMPKAISSLGNLLDIMYKDPDFAAALARLANRVGYRPTYTAAGLVHTIVNYPGIDAFLTKTLGLIAPGGTAETEFKQLNHALSMEMRSSVPVANPADPERTLRVALNLLLSTHPDLKSNTPLPLTQRDYRGLAMAAAQGGTVVPPFVDVNPKDGLADVDGMGHYVDANGKPIDVPTPFAEAGATDTAPRDGQGRALSAPTSTSLLYQYLDLDGTVIGGLNREAITLMDPVKDTSLGLVFGASALLGPRTTQTKVYMDPAGGMLGALSFQGFDTNQSAALDLLHAFIQLLGDPNIQPTLETASTLLTQFESPASRAIGAMLDASDRGKMHPEAMVNPASNLYDDLMPTVVRVLRVPGLAQDVLKALEDPRMKAFAPMIARLMAANDQIDFDHTMCGSPPCAYPLTNNLAAPTAVNRAIPDTDYNRSLMQRIAHLIHDSNGVQFCNKDKAAFTFILPFGPYAKCGLFKIDDLALFYVLNMASDSIRTDKTNHPSAYYTSNFCENIQDGTVKAAALGGLANLESQTGIQGFKCAPTPHALNRALFLRQDEKSSFMAGTTDDIVDSDGDKFIEVHDKSIFAWETPLVGHPEAADFYAAVQPLVDAFAKHDECIARDAATNNCTKTQNAAKIFVDLFAQLHTHYGSPQSSFFGRTYQSSSPTAPHYAQLDNVVSYEPLLAEVLGQADLVPAIIALAPTLNSVNTDGTPAGGAGIPMRNALVAAAQYLLDPVNAAANKIAYRDGSTTTVMSDGKTPVARATPYYLLADAFAHKRAALAAGTAQQSTSWKASTSALIDQMLTVEKLSSGAYQLKNRRMHAITLNIVDWLRGRLDTHAMAGDLSEWTHKTLTQDLTDTLGGPVFAALSDFVAKVEGDPDARTQLYGLLSYLVDEVNHDTAFQTSLITLADQVQMFMDDPNLVPVAHVMGSAMDPSNDTLDNQLTLVKKSHDVDTQRALLTVLRNLYNQNAKGGYPASDLADVLSELNRAHPGHGGPLDAGDYKSILGEVRDFLLDDQRGFTRFLNIVKARGPH